MFPSLRYNPTWGVGERLYIEDVERLGHPLVARIAQVLSSHYAIAGQYVSEQRVLDIACGSGYGSRMLHEAGASQVVGCDLAESPLAYARVHHALDGITYVQGDAETFAWEHQFDVVCSFETIEHLRHPNRLLDRIDELLTADGLLCLSVPIGETRHLDPFHLSIFSEAEVVETLQQRGFRIVRSSTEPLRFRGRDLVRMGQLMPETRPTWPDLFLTRRGWWLLGALAAGAGSIRFSQLLVIARRETGGAAQSAA